MIKYAGDKRQILLSFTSDPYQPLEEKLKITRAALKILIGHACKITILTKGGRLAQRDFDLLKLSYHSEFATTLTTIDPAESILWEPGAALPAQRLDNLMAAKKMGISTWVSFEPVVDCQAVFRLLEMSHEFVDLYKVGKLNYHKHSASIDWPAFREEIIARLEALGKRYIIKKDLLEA